MPSECRPDGTCEGSLGESTLDRRAAFYLFAIFVLATEKTDWTTTGEIHEHMGVTAASVTEMMTKLDADGYVRYEKYRGVQLTNRGDDVAVNLARRSCLASIFFESVVGVPLDEETAFEVGFILPQKGISQLADLVSTSCLETCPESDPDSATRAT